MIWLVATLLYTLVLLVGDVAGLVGRKEQKLFKVCNTRSKSSYCRITANKFNEAAILFFCAIPT